MCDVLIPALLGLGLLAAVSGGGCGDSCDDACYSACNTCGTSGYGAYHQGGYAATPTYAPSPGYAAQRAYAPAYAPAPGGAKQYTPMANYNYGYGNSNVGYSSTGYYNGGEFRKFQCFGWLALTKAVPAFLK